MSEWVIDPTNPGEVLACAGIAHLAWRRDRQSATGFGYDGMWRFYAPDSILEDLPTPAVVESEDGIRLLNIELDWWQEWGLNPPLKTWAGQQSPLSVHRNLALAAGDTPPREWQTLLRPTTGRLNLDVQGSWNALSNGWSVNEHKHIQMLCRPWLELLASIGLQAFPVQGNRRDGLQYHLWRPLPLAAANAAFAGHGRKTYALGSFIASIRDFGSNKMLLRAASKD